MARSPESLLAIPNLLSLSRLPLTVLLCLCIANERWLMGLGVFIFAALTDWLDGWWARRYQLTSLMGRNLDPLTDKVLLGSAFIFFIPLPSTGIAPWMVAIVMGRELLVTGLRGIVESSGAKFGADWFGKLKTVLQFMTIVVILAHSSGRLFVDHPDLLAIADLIQTLLIYAMLFATIGSGMQYLYKAFRLMK